MPHSYVSSLMHCIFSTKERRPIIVPDLKERLLPFMGGIARQNEMKMLAAGATEDHAHILLVLPATIAVSKAILLTQGRNGAKNEAEV